MKGAQEVHTEQRIAPISSGKTLAREMVYR
jgi:hypothetical protein